MAVYSCCRLITAFLLLYKPKKKKKGYKQIPHQCQMQQSSLFSCSDIKLIEFSLIGKLRILLCVMLYMLLGNCYTPAVSNKQLRVVDYIVPNIRGP